MIIEDDEDDREVYSFCIEAVGITNELRFFAGCKEALDYLINSEEQPFAILSDINLPGMTGLELKKQIQDDPYLCTKGVPFVFISTSASNVSVRHAYALGIQGYFQKPNNIDEIKKMLRTIFDYWESCKHINNT